MSQIYQNDNETEWELRNPKKNRLELWRKKPGESWRLYGGVSGAFEARERFRRQAEIIIENEKSKEGE